VITSIDQLRYTAQQPEDRGRSSLRGNNGQPWGTGSSAKAGTSAIFRPGRAQEDEAKVGATALALAGCQANPLFSGLDKLVLDYPVGMPTHPGRRSRRTVRPRCVGMPPLL